MILKPCFKVLASVVLPPSSWNGGNKLEIRALHSCVVFTLAIPPLFLNQIEVNWVNWESVGFCGGTVQKCSDQQETWPTCNAGLGI